VPAARAQVAEEGAAACRFVEVEWLGVELLRELLDLFGDTVTVPKSRTLPAVRSSQ